MLVIADGFRPLFLQFHPWFHYLIFVKLIGIDLVQIWIALVPELALFPKAWRNGTGADPKGTGISRSQTRTDLLSAISIICVSIVSCFISSNRKPSSITNIKVLCVNNSFCYILLYILSFRYCFNLINMSQDWYEYFGFSGWDSHFIIFF